MRRLCWVTGLGILLAAAPAFSQSTAVSFEKLAVADTAVNFANATLMPTGKSPAQSCEGLVELAEVRYRVDGTAAAAATGMLAPIGSTITISGADNLRKFSVIRVTTTSAAMNMTCYPTETGASATLARVPTVAYSAGGFLAQSGTAAAPGYAFVTDASNDTGFYYITADRIGVSAGGTLRWDWNTTRILSTVPYTYGTTAISGTSASGLKVAGTAPTIASGFGTTPTIAGSDTGFIVNVGTSSATTGVVTFAGEWAAQAPVCVGSIASNTAAHHRVIGVVATTTTATISFAEYDGNGVPELVAPTNSSSVAVMCIGY